MTTKFNIVIVVIAPSLSFSWMRAASEKSTTMVISKAKSSKMVCKMCTRAITLLVVCCSVVKETTYFKKSPCYIFNLFRAILEKHTCITSSLAKPKWSAFLEGQYVTQLIHNGDIGATNWML